MVNFGVMWMSSLKIKANQTINHKNFGTPLVAGVLCLSLKKRWGGRTAASSVKSNPVSLQVFREASASGVGRSWRPDLFHWAPSWLVLWPPSWVPRPQASFHTQAHSPAKQLGSLEMRAKETNTRSTRGVCIAQAPALVVTFLGLSFRLMSAPCYPRKMRSCPGNFQHGIL